MNEMKNVRSKQINIYRTKIQRMILQCIRVVETYK